MAAKLSGANDGLFVNHSQLAQKPRAGASPAIASKPNDHKFEDLLAARPQAKQPAREPSSRAKPTAAVADGSSPPKQAVREQARQPLRDRESLDEARTRPRDMEAKQKLEPEGQAMASEDHARTAAAKLKAWGREIKALGGSAEDTPILALLKGDAQHVQASALPQLLAENPFMQEALSGDMEDLLAKKFPLGELASMLGLSSASLARASELGVNLQEPVATKQLLRTLGIDASEAVAETDRLKATLTSAGLAPYMLAGDPEQGMPSIAPADLERGEGELREALSDEEAAAKAAAFAAASGVGLAMPLAQPLAKPPVVVQAPTGEGVLATARNPSGRSTSALAAGQDELAALNTAWPPVSGEEGPWQQGLGLSEKPTSEFARLEQGFGSGAGREAPQLGAEQGLSLPSSVQEPLEGALAGPLPGDAHLSQAGDDALAKPLRPETIPAGQPRSSMADAASAQPIAGGLLDLAEKIAQAASQSQAGQQAVVRPQEDIAPNEEATLSEHSAPQLSAATLKSGLIHEQGGRAKAGSLYAMQADRLAAGISARGQDGDFTQGESAFERDEGRQRETISSAQSGERLLRPEVTPFAETALPGSFEASLQGGAATPGLAGASDLSAAAKTKLMEQVLDRSQMMLHEGGGTALVKVHDKDAGEVSLAVQVNGDEVRLKMLSPSEQLRNLLGAELGQLRETLAAQNLQLVDVDLGHDRHPGGQESAFQQFDFSQQRQGLHDERAGQQQLSATAISTPQQGGGQPTVRSRTEPRQAPARAHNQRIQVMV